MKREKCKRVNLETKIFFKENDKQKETRKGKSKRSAKERGITLIALVITIIIMLILSGITLNAALGENGLIERAKKAAATYKKAEEDESKGMEQLIEEMDKVNGGNGETAPSPEPTETTEPTPEITTSPDPTPTPQVSVEDLNGKVNNGEADSVLGKEVTGLTQATGLSETYKWQIFDVDENHIWLIAKDYIQVADCPQTKNGLKVTIDSTYYGRLTYVIENYIGAIDVADDLRTLNKQFFAKAPSSRNNNAKAMAYLLDKSIWTSQFIGDASKDKVDYVIGCPTLEQIAIVHNKKHPTEKIETQSTATGYQIKKGNSEWATWQDDVLSTLDSELVINDDGLAWCAWVASPGDWGEDWVMCVDNTGGVGFNGIGTDGSFYYSYGGFRPVICLNSSVKLTKLGDTYTIE